MMENSKESHNKRHRDDNTHQPSDTKPRAKPKEIGGPKGLEPTRYGDWEKKGRCIDF
jgi:hypothetical protein